MKINITDNEPGWFKVSSVFSLTPKSLYRYRLDAEYVTEYADDDPVEKGFVLVLEDGRLLDLEGDEALSFWGPDWDRRAYMFHLLPSTTSVTLSN